MPIPSRKFVESRRMRQRNIFPLVFLLCLIVFAPTLAAKPFQSPSSSQPAPEIVRARTLLNSPDWEKAAPIVKSYLSRHEDSADAHALMGLILYRQQQPKASMAEYVRASQLSDLTAFDLRIFALDCAAIPDLPEAEKWLLRSIEKDDRDAATWEALGHVRFSQQHYEATIEALDHALLLAPRTVSSQTLIALSNERLAKLDAAEAAYRTAIQWQDTHKVKDPIPFTGLGRVLLADNKPAEAVHWLEEAAKFPPPSADVHELLGQAYSKTDRQSEAAAQLEIAIKLQPQNARLHLVLSRIYRALGSQDKAGAELAAYSRLNGNNAK